MTLPFKLPTPEGSLEVPEWNGDSFVLGQKHTRVLEYNENLDGWSDALTALHEEVSGEDHPIDVASRREAIEQIERYAPRPASVVVEIGCSSGFLLRDLARTLPEAVLVGSDVVKDALYRLAERLPGVPLIRFDILQCPFKESIADVVVMLNVLEHIEDDTTALRKVFGLLKPGGTLVLEVPASPKLYDRYDAELLHYRRYSSTQLTKKLQDCGFEVVRRSHLGFVVFPAFAAVKLVGKWLRDSEGRSTVTERAERTAASRPLRIAMAVERRLFGRISLPFGIRVTAVARRARTEGRTAVDAEVSRTRPGAFLRYALVGALNTALYCALLWAFIRRGALPYPLSVALAFLLSMCFQYFANKYFTFKVAKRSVSEVVRYIVAAAANYGLSVGIVWTGLDVFHLSRLMICVVSAGIVGSTGFLLSLLWVFRQGRAGHSEG